MINNKIITEVAQKLPMLMGKVSEQELRLLALKWGLLDGSTYTAKHIERNIKLGFKMKEIHIIESRAVDYIDSETNKLFTCSSCNNDIRKGGIVAIVQHEEVSDIFLGQDGGTNRVTNKESRARSGKYKCKQCGDHISNFLTWFIEEPMSLATLCRAMQGEGINIDMLMKVGIRV